MDKQIIVYTMDDCIECNMVKQVLTEEGIPFEVRNISDVPAYQKEVEQYGFLGIPVTVLGDMVVKGFTNELKVLLEKAKKQGKKNAK